MNASDRTVVLVHGSWLGAWAWRAVAAELTRQGASVHIVALSGLGARATESRPDIGLETHVDDVLAYIDALDAPSLTIAGHSYGSLVASEAAALRPERTDALVVVDGMIAEAGRSLFELVPQVRDALTPLFDSAADFILPPPPEFLGLTPSDLEGVTSALTPMPLLTHTQATRFSASALTCGLHYLGFSGFFLGEALAAEADRLGWRAKCVPGSHMSIIEQPQAVAQFILEAT